jgi:hypothetical protein
MASSYKGALQDRAPSLHGGGKVTTVDVILGTVHDQIYKIARQLAGLSGSDAGILTRNVFVYVTQQPGSKPKTARFSSGVQRMSFSHGKATAPRSFQWPMKRISSHEN